MTALPPPEQFNATFLSLKIAIVCLTVHDPVPIPKNRIHVAAMVMAGHENIPVNVAETGCPYLVPADLTVGQFVYVVRKRIKLSAEKAIFIFVKNILPPTAAMMSAIYEENKDEDGFLYMTYSGENTFGLI
ncbi:hypothetical protein E3N88_26215 [Mikania micrantha]|uniref:Autophagy-related protein n=1 Tax=Mikania micrantha TaxID=192012 RepID=A0A5N6N8E9_9ASTR|nr:hypothetical protein E3N88_26215 [Mikania micrantha]